MNKLRSIIIVRCPDCGAGRGMFCDHSALNAQRAYLGDHYHRNTKLPQVYHKARIIAASARLNRRRERQ